MPIVMRGFNGEGLYEDESHLYSSRVMESSFSLHLLVLVGPQSGTMRMTFTRSWMILLTTSSIHSRVDSSTTVRSR